MIRFLQALFLLVILSFQSQAQTFDRILTTDVLVVGGTASGVCAGIQSARLGVTTLIIESTPWLGGMLTAAGVSAIDGNDAMPAGIFGEFKKQLALYYGGEKKLSTGWVSNTLFEPHIGDSIFKNMAAKEMNLLVNYNCTFTKLIKEGSQIKGVVCVDKKNQQTILIQAKIFIDATELGDVLSAASLAYDIGMESNEQTHENVNMSGANGIIQDITYVAILKDFGKPQPLITRPINYDSLEFDASNSNFYFNTNLKKPTVDARAMLNYGKLPNNKYMLNWPIFGNDTYLNIIEKTPAEREILVEQAKQQTLRYVYFIQKDLGFSNLALAEDEFLTKDKLAFYPYYRESRRIKGKVRMTVQHISAPFATDQALYRTGIAVGDYPIDHHHKKNKEAPQHLDFFPVPSFNIPLGVLIPKDGGNLIIAEKSISVSNIVNGTTRLQPCVMQIGQAAGLLAALSTKENCNPENISVRKLQSILLETNAYIMPYKDVPLRSTYFKAIQKIGATGLLRGVGVPSGWANATYFYPDDKVNMAEFLTTWRQKFNISSVVNKEFMTIEDAQSFAEQLKGKNKKKCKVVWDQIGLKNFTLQRPILRYELAAILNEYNVFSSFDVDLYGELK
jgi:hypothetical protein